jgi:hypothetical protein
MPFDLDIEFGGLCMFVDGANHEGKRLFVLMPVMRGHHARDDHRPTLLFTMSDGNEAQIRLAEGSRVRLGDFSKTGSRAKMPLGLGCVSKYAGSSVDEKWLNEIPADDLAVRIELPPGLDVKPEGKCANLKITYDGSETKQKLYGRASVRNIPVSESSITIGPVKLTPKHNKLAIKLVNLPQADIDNPNATYPCKPGNRVPHFAAYYKMLAPHAAEPELLIDDCNCSSPEALGVDPYRCTVGFGCPSGSTDC